MFKSSFFPGLAILAFVTTLTGCNAVSTLPSMQHCSHVKYERNGVDMIVEAKCHVPIGGSGL